MFKLAILLSIQWYWPEAWLSGTDYGKLKVDVAIDSLCEVSYSNLNPTPGGLEDAEFNKIMAQVFRSSSGLIEYGEQDGWHKKISITHPNGVSSCIYSKDGSFLGHEVESAYLPQNWKPLVLEFKKE